MISTRRPTLDGVFCAICGESWTSSYCATLQPSELTFGTEMMAAKVRIDVASGVIEVEGDEAFISDVLAKYEPTGLKIDKPASKTGIPER